MRWLKSIFAWRTVADTGVWLYEQNDITGARRVCRVGGGHQPQAMGWVERRTDDPPGSLPAPKGTGQFKVPRGEPAIRPAAAQGIEARSAETSGSAEGESPVAEGDAPAKSEQTDGVEA